MVRAVPSHHNEASQVGQQRLVAGIQQCGYTDCPGLLIRLCGDLSKCDGASAASKAGFVTSCFEFFARPYPHDRHAVGDAKKGYYQCSANGARDQNASSRIVLSRRWSQTAMMTTDTGPCAIVRNIRFGSFLIFKLKNALSVVLSRSQGPRHHSKAAARAMPKAKADASTEY